MKKIFSLLLTLSLVFCLTPAAFADATQTEYNWTDVGSAVLDYFGDDSNICKIDEVDAASYGATNPLTRSIALGLAVTL